MFINDKFIGYNLRLQTKYVLPRCIKIKKVENNIFWDSYGKFWVA